jgi:hypothetical protein
VKDELSRLKCETGAIEQEVQSLRHEKAKIKERIERVKPIGTFELGSKDEANDGQSTRRRRRKVIVLQMQSGSTLSQTLH